MNPDLETIVGACIAAAVLVSIIYAIKKGWERDFIERVCIGGPM